MSLNFLINLNWFCAEIEKQSNVVKLIFIIILKNVCVFVCVTAYRVGPWHDTNLKLVSLEPVPPKVETLKKISRKVTSGQIMDTKCLATNVFLWKILLYIFAFILNGLMTQIIEIYYISITRAAIASYFSESRIQSKFEYFYD